MESKREKLPEKGQITGQMGSGKVGGQTVENMGEKLLERGQTAGQMESRQGERGKQAL